MSAAAGGSTKPSDPAGNGLLHDPENLDELVKLKRMIRRSGEFRIAFAAVNHTSLRARLIEQLHKQLAGLTLVELRVSPTPNVTVAELESISGRGTVDALLVSGLDEVGSDENRSRIIAELNVNRDRLWRSTSIPVVVLASDFAINQFAHEAPDLWSGRSGVYSFRGEGNDVELSIKEIAGDINWGSTSGARRERDAKLRDLLQECGEDPSARNRLLKAIADSASIQGRYDEAQELYERALAYFRETGDKAAQESTAEAARRNRSLGLGGARVFISHAGSDADLAARLGRWLADEGFDVFLDHDLNEGITLGEDWQQRLQERLRWADAVVCVVTSAYLTSVWCTAELAVAQAQGSRLLPVRAEPGAVHPLLRTLQQLDMATGEAAVREGLLTALRRIAPSGEFGIQDSRSPFPGLRPFDADMHQVFFGRTAEIEQLATLLRSPAERRSGAVLLVVGPSGCGKSSLVRAGLLPVMANEPDWLTVPAILPGAQPVAALIRALAATATRWGLRWTTAEVRRRLDDGGLAELAYDLLNTGMGPGRRQLLIVVDQFEELLTQSSATERARFVELLRPALSKHVRVVATLRPEFLDQVLTAPELVELAWRVSPLRPLRRDALRLVIEGPARLAGFDVEEGLAARLVDDTGSGDALPLLAYTLAQLAEGVGRGGRLLLSRYEQIGGVKGALAVQADAALAAAIAAGGRRPEDVTKELLRLVTVDDQGRPTRFRVRHDELPEVAAVELDAFIARRLLTTDVEDDATVVGVAHEAFLSSWPPLANAIAAASVALRARRQIEQAAADWTGHGRASDRLWERGQLAAALADTGARLVTGTASTQASADTTLVSRRPAVRSRFLGRHQQLVAKRVELSAAARHFLLASIQRDRRLRGRAVAVLSALLVVSLVSLVAVGIATVQQRTAQQQQRAAVASQLILQASTIEAADPRTALQLSIAAARILPSAATQASLVYAVAVTGNRLGGQPYDLVQPYPLGEARVGQSESVAFSPDGRTLAIADLDGSVALWDVADPTQPRRLGPPLTGHTGAVTSVAFAPNGRTLATGSADQTAILWDVTDPTQPRRLGPPLTGHTGAVTSVAFAPNGRTLATGSADQTAILWDVTDPTQPRRLGPPLTGHTGALTSVAFSRDGRTLAIADLDGSAALWDVADPARSSRAGTLTGHTGAVTSVAFAPNGRTLATGSADQTAILWDVTDPTQPRRLGPPLTGHTGAVTSVAFAPNGRTLATGSADQTAILWDVTDPTQPRRLAPPLTDHTGAVTSVAFAPNGQTLATGARDGSITWQLTQLESVRRDPIGTACRIAGSGLDAEKWRLYIPDLPYADTCAA